MDTGDIEKSCFTPFCMGNQFVSCCEIVFYNW